MWQGRAEETEVSCGQRGRRKICFKEEDATKSPCWGTGEGFGETELERKIARVSLVLAMRKLLVTPVDSSLEKRGQTPRRSLVRD